MINKTHYYKNVKAKSRAAFIFLAIVVMMLQSTIISSNAQEQEKSEVVTFEIKGFTLEGNTLLTDEDRNTLLAGYVGQSKTSTDVEKARDTLESFYHKSGYPAVLVNIPEQDVESGLVRLEVIESRIRKVNVTGNRYFTKTTIMKMLPSIREGGLIYLPSIQQDFALANRNSDLKISPALVPSKELGAVDINLKVSDKLPLHGSLELNNRSSHSTTSLRANGSISYNNLWQKEHAISLQYQTSPKDRQEVQLLVGSYIITTPWNKDHTLSFYGVWSDSDNAFSDGFQVVGKGSVLGARYTIPLPLLEKGYHSITLGIDYKNFKEDVNFIDSEQEGLRTPIKYVPLSSSYTAVISNGNGKTQVDIGLNLALRNLGAEQREFEIKRYNARGGYLYFTGGMSRSQNLPYGMSVVAKVDGQIASEPLISNEQFSAGGMESVRGYKESEASGDTACHWMLNVNFPDLAELFNSKEKFNGIPYLFYDGAKTWKKDPLEGEDKSNNLQGAGIGLKGSFLKNFEYKLDGAIALDKTDNVDRGDKSFYFRVKYGF
jgi:hemolysin activation/secretion protein